MSLILAILAIIIIAAILIAVILNPIRLRIRASHSVFEVEATEEDISSVLRRGRGCRGLEPRLCVGLPSDGRWVG